MADLLAEQMAGLGLVARLGGDELGVLLEGRQAPRAHELAEMLRAATEAAAPVSPTAAPLSLSVGVCTAADALAVPAIVMRAADQELYRAKTTRNSVSAAALTPELPQPRSGSWLQRANR